MEKIIQERYVQLENVSMSFVTKKGTFEALRGIDLNIREGEFISVIGHSGCGKSTVLNLIAGLLQPTSGLLFCAGREIAGPGPERAVVFQNHSLLPWLTCSENVHLAVERVFGKKEDKAQLRARTRAALEQASQRDIWRHEAARWHRPRAGDGTQGAAAG
jgi:nitrate/nitrite transport system ATP-binding protein